MYNCGGVCKELVNLEWSSSCKEHVAHWSYASMKSVFIIPWALIIVQCAYVSYVETCEESKK